MGQSVKIDEAGVDFLEKFSVIGRRRSKETSLLER